jgi:hypothetical protein
VIEPVPASLIDAHIRVACPVKSCAKDIVGVIRRSGGFGILTTEAARKDAWRQVARAQMTDVTLALVATTATVGLTLFLALWQCLNPGPSFSMGTAVLSICATGFVIVVVVWRSISHSALGHASLTRGNATSRTLATRCVPRPSSSHELGTSSPVRSVSCT